MTKEQRFYLAKAVCALATDDEWVRIITDDEDDLVSIGFHPSTVGEEMKVYTNGDVLYRNSHDKDGNPRIVVENGKTRLKKEASDDDVGKLDVYLLQLLDRHLPELINMSKHHGDPTGDLSKEELDKNGLPKVQEVISGGYCGPYPKPKKKMVGPPSKRLPAVISPDWD